MDIVVSWHRRTMKGAKPRSPAIAVSDGMGCLPGVIGASYAHTAIPACGGVPDPGRPILWWVYAMLGNVMNAMHGTYHALRPKYLQRYLSE